MNKGFEVWFQNSGRKSKRRGTCLEALSLEAQLERFHQQDQTLSVLHLKRKNNVINKIISGEVLHLCIRVRNRDSEPEPDLNQCCGSMTFWGGSGSGFAVPCLWLMDPNPDSDPDPGFGSCYFLHWPSRCQQKTNFSTQFFLLITFWRYIYIIFRR